MSETKYVSAFMKYKHEGLTSSEATEVIIGVGEIDWENDPVLDERVFFYVENEEELAELYNRDNGEDFYLLDEEQI